MTYLAEAPAKAKQIGLDALRIPYHIAKDVLPYPDDATLKASRIVVGILARRVAAGLVVEAIDVDVLTDYDAGRWSEVVFTIKVNLDSTAANQEWDSFLAELSDLAESQPNKEVASVLRDRIAIHFRWVHSSCV